MPSAFRARISAFRAKIYKILMFCDIIQHVVSKTQQISKSYQLNRLTKSIKRKKVYMKTQFLSACRKTIAFILTACLLTGCSLMNRTENQTEVDLDSIQKISYDASEDYEKALSIYEKGCEPAGIIRDDENATDKQIALIIQGTSDRVLTERVLEELENHHVKVTFAATAMDSAEDDETLKLISKKGHDIINNGLYDDVDIETLSDQEMISDFSYSAKVFTTLLDFPIDKMMLNGIFYTDDICQKAYACGFKKVIAPLQGNYLNKGSFKDKEKANEYIARKNGSTILVYKLNGYIGPLEYEPKQEYQKPAIDKQATIKDNEKTENEKEIDTVTVLGWLLDAIDSQDYKLVSLDSLPTKTNEQYISELIEKNMGVKAECYKNAETMESVVGLAFFGVPKDEETADQIVSILNNSNSHATFFVTKKEVEENKDILNVLAQGGFGFATRGTEGTDLLGKDVYSIYEDITAGARSIKKNLSVKCKYYCPSSVINDNILIAAGVAGMDVITPVDESGSIKGDIKLIRMDEDFDISKLESFISSSNTAKLEIVDITSLIKAAKSVPNIGETQLIAMRDANEGKLANERRMVYTSEKAMVMSFYGIENQIVLKDVLGILEKRNYKGTFFVSMKDMLDYPDSISQIIGSGSEIGIAYTVSAEYPDDFDSVASYIIGAQQYLKWKYDVDTKIVCQPYGEISDETKEAVSATGCQLVGHEYSLVHSTYADAKQVKDFYYNNSSKIDPHRGSIVFFHMNCFTADKNLSADAEDTLLGDLVDTFISNKIDALVYTDVYGNRQPSTAYTVKSYSAVNSSACTYAPGRRGNSSIDMNKNVLANMGDDESQTNYMASRYIGNPDVSEIPGFSKAEMAKFDQKGKISSDNVIFLTFDDWGYEKNINELLYVLDKYAVKGNFFVRTNNVSNNPNLLRAIAADGHMVGSHSNTHMPMWSSSVDEMGNYSFESMSEEEAASFRKDIVTSYTVLNRYIGDVSVGGRPSLTTIYRPPTLAVSRIGMYQLYDVGFSYIVSGDISTSDYAAGSVDELVNTLRGGKQMWYGLEKVTGGSCLVMHMSPEAQYTAEALDIMIPEWQAQGYTIARIDDYLR